MRWQWKLGRFAGIDVFVHATFLLLIGWVGLSVWLDGRGLAAALRGVAFILALFLCVVLHEYGHALTARRFGVKTRDITLYPIGGVARLERMPERPIEELWVALIGPAVNVVIAGILLVCLAGAGSLGELRAWDLTSGSFVSRLLVVNLTLAVFNLIPAFPMDGGRVLRALLAMRMEFVRATQISAAVGQGIALIFGFIGLFANPFLLFIALFVWIGAAQEANLAQVKHSIGGIPVARAMQTEYQTLAPGDTLASAIGAVLAGSQHDFPVVEGEKVVGVLTRDALIRALSKEGQNAPVSTAMRRDLPEVDSHEMIEQALTRLEEAGAKILPVVHGGRLVGLITAENITEFLMIRSALRASQAATRQ